MQILKQILLYFLETVFKRNQLKTINACIYKVNSIVGVSHEC